MDLKEFVSETLVQIVAGVKEAQSQAKELGAQVNPNLIGGSSSDAAKEGYLRIAIGYAQIVHFDVALTVTEGTGTKGGIGVFTGAVNLGSTGQSKSESLSASRVQFSVPMALPPSE
jgi:hypothetical protein